MQAMTITPNHPVIEPYLFFDGRCEEAIEFYRRALGAEVSMLMRFKDSPEPPPPRECAAGAENKVMHASLRIGGTTLMASDGRCQGKPSFEGFSLSLAVPDEAGAERSFAALADGGQVQMPLARTFFAPRFGMVADRFGLSWMIIVVPPSKPFVISHTFDAPRERVWKAWTERDRLMHWFGPKGSTMAAAKLDFRPGGKFHYCLKTPEGQPMWARFVYREIAAPERIVWVHSFSDEHGGLARAPFSDTWPLELVAAATLSSEGGRTKVTIEWAPLKPTEAEQKTFDALHESMTQGWTGTFEQLAAYLAKA
jgi:PhnB protein